jgi:hypothetical protein
MYEYGSDLAIFPVLAIFPSSTLFGSKREEQEEGEKYTLRRFIIRILRQIVGYYGDQIKDDQTDGECSTHGVYEKLI